MRHLLYIVLALTLFSFASCGKGEEPNPEELVAKTAKTYYDYLIQGKYDAYVDGFYRPDSIPGSYREQLIVSAKQYVWQVVVVCLCGFCLRFIQLPLLFFNIFRTNENQVKYSSLLPAIQALLHSECRRMRSHEQHVYERRLRTYPQVLKHRMCQ